MHFRRDKLSATNKAICVSQGKRPISLFVPLISPAAAAKSQIESSLSFRRLTCVNFLLFPFLSAPPLWPSFKQAYVRGLALKFLSKLLNSLKAKRRVFPYWIHVKSNVEFKYFSLLPWPMAKARARIDRGDRGNGIFASLSILWSNVQNCKVAPSNPSTDMREFIVTAKKKYFFCSSLFNLS